MGTERAKIGILIVDDDLDSLAALAEILSCAGYIVATAATGREAIDRLRNLPDLRLMILDMVIPDIDGFQLLELRARESALARVPIIAMSGLDQRVDVHAQVRKPFDVQHLLKLVELMVLAGIRATGPEI